MANQRTDVHRPSTINPDDYEFVACECVKIENLADCAFIQEQRERLRAHMARTGGTYSQHEHGGNCHICGSVNAVYTVLFYHRPTNSYVRTGTDCADKLDAGCADAFRSKCKNVLEARAGRRKAEAMLAEKGLSAAWTIYISSAPGQKREESTIVDIVGRLVKYGSASEAQIAYMGKLLHAIAERPAREAKIAEERANALPVPTGRIKVCGTVVSVKIPQDDNGFFSVRMLVKSDDGWCVFGSVPSSLQGEEESLRGKRVCFKATVTASKDDPKFGFFKRPTNAEIVEVQL